MSTNRLASLRLLARVSRQPHCSNILVLSGAYIYTQAGRPAVVAVDSYRTLSSMSVKDSIEAQKVHNYGVEHVSGVQNVGSCRASGQGFRVEGADQSPSCSDAFRPTLRFKTFTSSKTQCSVSGLTDVPSKIS